MKIEDLKKIFKEVVREVFQEELKQIVLESIRSSKPMINESLRDTYAQPHLDAPKKLTPQERQNMFSGMIDEMKNGGMINSSYAGNINPTGPVDNLNGALPEGNVGLDQIMSLMNK